MCRPSGRDADAARVQAAISDVVPAPLRTRVDDHLQESDLTAGRLTRLAAEAVDREADPEELDRRVVGVQLIYEGLKITRTLVRAPPWADEPAVEADLNVLVADVLVARGFSLLAQTEATDEAVETIRRFARDETNRGASRPDSAVHDHALEADIFELSIVAGVTATGVGRPNGTRAFATTLAASLDADAVDEDRGFPESVDDRLATFLGE